MVEISQAEKCFKAEFFLNVILKLCITTKLDLDILGCKESNLTVCLAHFWNACSLQFLYCYLTMTVWGKPLHILSSTSSLRCQHFGGEEGCFKKGR